MIDWAAVKNSKEETWGALMEYAIPLGVTVGRVEEVEYDGTKYGPFDTLHHNVNGEIFTSIMPKGCVPERRLRFGRLAAICRELRLKEPKWPITY